MPHSFSRIVVSILTLNSLLQIYENQPFEFNDSNLMMQHPQLTSIIPTNQMINLTVGISTFFLIDWKNKLYTIISILFGISVMMQNINILLPKTINIIQIYLQLLITISHIFNTTKKLYQCVKTLEINKTTIEFQQKTQLRRKFTKVSKKAEKQKLKQVNTQMNENEAKIVKDEMQVEAIQVKNEQKQEQQSNKIIQEQHISEAEVETENQCEINHSDLSQISSIKEEQSIALQQLELQIQLKFNGKNEQFCCSFDTFDTISTILSGSFTDKQIIQIKIHILLNFYDENQDCSCRFWCIKKLLAFQF